ncbi:hypothetical protein L3i22_070970 [Actinoplanes sp. L3-i22]|nr:hypothetical protein L3i22_070970 [Actinoplanes sp. L3-i22]
MSTLLGYPQAAVMILRLSGTMEPEAVSPLWEGGVCFWPWRRAGMERRAGAGRGRHGAWPAQCVAGTVRGRHGAWAGAGRGRHGAWPARGVGRQGSVAGRCGFRWRR